MGISQMREVLSREPPPPPKPRPYHPNREPLVVLECGCIESSWLLIHELAGKDYQYCARHPESESEWGQRILRDAVLAELVRWYEYGEAAPKRRSSKPPDWMRILSAEPKPNRAGATPEALF